MGNPSHKPNHIKYERVFTPLDQEEELTILLNDDDDFTNTKRYLNALILQALDRFELDEEQHKILHWQLINDVPLAATRFLERNKLKNANYRFCTYFGHYIGERINRIEGLQRAVI